VMRNSQSHLSLLVEEEYRSLSLRLSQGLYTDVLNLMDSAGKGRRILQDIFPTSLDGVHTMSRALEAKARKPRRDGEWRIESELSLRWGA
jgi:hypothetical protein